MCPRIRLYFLESSILCIRFYMGRLAQLVEHVRFCFVYSHLQDDAAETVTSHVKRVVIGSNPILPPSHGTLRVMAQVFLSKWEPPHGGFPITFLLEVIK